MSEKTSCALRMSGDELKEAVAEYNGFFDALKKCFVGRDNVIDILRTALIQKQHILIFGSPGTSKTAIFDVMYSGIVDGNGFHTELSMFMTDDALYGPYNPKKMREEGVLEHNVHGMLPEANLARLGEFLDANMPLLRSTLSVLNEKRLKRGTQDISIPLITAYCDTNTSPRDFLAFHPEAEAVFDRFLYITNVGYLQSEEEISEMLNRFQTGKVNRLSKKLSIHLINRLSRLILQPPTIIKNQIIFIKLAKALLEYRLERRNLFDKKDVNLILPDISDRRFCWASQVAEVNAILNGRDEVIPEDILSLSPALGTTKEEEDIWKNIAEKIVGEIYLEMKMQIENAQYIALDGLMKELEGISGEDITEISELQKEGAMLKGIKQQLDTILPENDLVAERKKEINKIYLEKISILKEKAAALTNVS